MEYPRIKELLQDDSYVNKRKGPPSAVAAAICGENGMEGFSVHAGSKSLLSRKGNGQLVIPL